MTQTIDKMTVRLFVAAIAYAGFLARNTSANPADLAVDAVKAADYLMDAEFKIQPKS